MVVAVELELHQASVKGRNQKGNCKAGRKEIVVELRLYQVIVCEQEARNQWK